MRPSTLILPVFVSLVTSFTFLAELSDAISKLQIVGVSPVSPGSGQNNTGTQPSLDFDPKEQYVDVSDNGPHGFVSPGSGDHRGPCPGLNAAANHNYLPRNGIATIGQAITGLGQAYGMSADLAGVLSAYAVALTGDYLTQTWSIGGPYSSALLGGLLSTPGGISNSHITYEGDASVTRSDSYLNNGNADALDMSKFDALYALGANGFTMDILRKHNKYVRDYSVLNNPYYFSAGIPSMVTPAAHSFIFRLMSNHSADQPSGYLNRDMLKTFFAVDGPDNAHVWHPGQERIPRNWYRRNSNNQYNVAKVLADYATTAVQYPDVVRIGGNTGTTNSFVGVNIGNLTGGIYTADNLFQGNNLGCFLFQVSEQAIPDQVAGLVSDATSVLNLVKQYVDPLLSGLNCPILDTYDQGLFSQYPGYIYKQPRQLRV